MGSALDSASLIMYPSGYSDGVLGSAKPTDGSGDFTFTRGSNLSATRVGPNGYIEKGYENLLLQSNSFLTSPWSVQFGSHTLTSGQAGYDGSNDGWLIQKESSSNHYVLQSISTSGVNTFSIYAKNNSVDGAGGLLIDTTLGSVIFNLESGAIYAQNGINSSIEPISNGWYRCSISVNGSPTLYRFQVVSELGSDDVIGKSIYIQDAMLNQGLVAYPYIETTTAPVAGGILEDEPRIDFSDGCGHLLLEPSRTNLIPYSEYANAVAGSLATITDNVTTSPEGVQNAARFLPTSAFGRWESDSFGSGITNGTTYVASMYFNTNSTLDIVTFYIGWNAAAGADRIGITFNPSTRAYISTFTYGSATLTDYDIGEADNNGWYRVSLIAPATNANASTCLVLRDLNSQANGSDFVDFYGWQMEQDATYPTSYIPTYGVSQTRLADYIDIPSSADLSIPSDSWTILYDISDDSIIPAGPRWVGDSLNNMNLYPVAPNKTRFYWRGIGQYIAPDGGSKVIARYDGTTATEFHDGVNKGSASYSGQLPFDFKNEFQLNSGKYFLNKIVIFPTALSDDECIALTTI